MNAEFMSNFNYISILFSESKRDDGLNGGINNSLVVIAQFALDYNNVFLMVHLYIIINNVRVW